MVVMQDSKDSVRFSNFNSERHVFAAIWCRLQVEIQRSNETNTFRGFCHGKGRDFRLSNPPQAIPFSNPLWALERCLMFFWSHKKVECLLLESNKYRPNSYIYIYYYTCTIYIYIIIIWIIRVFLKTYTHWKKALKNKIISPNIVTTLWCSILPSFAKKCPMSKIDSSQFACPCEHGISNDLGNSRNVENVSRQSGMRLSNPDEMHIYIPR